MSPRLACISKGLSDARAARAAAVGTGGVRGGAGVDAATNTTEDRPRGPRGRNIGDGDGDGDGDGAGAGATVITTPPVDEFVSSDYKERIAELIDNLRGTAISSLVSSVENLDNMVLEQAVEVQGEVSQLRILNTEISKLKEQLEAADKKRILIETRLKWKPAAPASRTSAGGGGVLRSAHYGGGAFDEKSTKELIDVKKEIEALKDKIQQKTVEYERIKGMYPKVPNERIYTDAFQSLQEIVDAYVSAVKAAVGAVMRGRRDGSVINMDPDTLAEAETALKNTFEEAEEWFKEAMMYMTDVKDAGGRVVYEKHMAKFMDRALEQDWVTINEVRIAERNSMTAAYNRILVLRQQQIDRALNKIYEAHRSSVRMLSKPKTFLTEMHRYDVGVVYALKLCRVGLAFSASFVASRVFENIYVERVSATEPDVPDLKWMVLTYMLFQLLFDSALMGVTYLVSNIVPQSIDQNILKDFLVDTVAATTMVGISLFPLADVIQDKRYFEYQVTAPRALRLMRSLMWSLAGFHAVVPYFYLTGPFYIQHRQAVYSK